MSGAASRLGLGLLLVALGPPFADAPARAQIIPPGQEELLGAMLGKGTQLPDDCSLAAGRIEHNVVQATYHCREGDVVIQLSHPSVGSAQAIVTKRFALTVASGAADADLLRAIEALVRSREAEFEWSDITDANARPSGLLALLLLGLAIPSSISAWHAWMTRAPLARGALVESLIVAAIVVVWLQIDADAPAHTDTAMDVALARDCIASSGSACLGHTASAIGLVHGQGFTYALAAWLVLGFSMRELCFVAACIHGATIGLLHYATARRFGGVAWVVSAVVAGLGVHMTSYPIIWSPSWFVLPLTIAFLCTLAIARGSGMWSAFLGGVAFAIGSESHFVFGPFVAVAAGIALLTAPRPVAAATVMLGSFFLTEMVISPHSWAINAHILRAWIGAHTVPAAAVALLFAASVPVQAWWRRAIRDQPGRRESAAVLVWLVTGTVVIGVMIPWAVSRPPQIRYYGLAFPAVAYAGAWLLDAATLRTRSARVRAVAIGAFAAVFARRILCADFAVAPWSMDDGKGVATAAGLTDASALDLLLNVRAMPAGSLEQVAAAYGGAPAPPSFPPRIVRVTRSRPGVEPPEGWTRIHLARGDVLTSEIDAWTRPEEAEVCPEPPTAEPCVTLARDDFSQVADAAGSFLHRLFGMRIARTATRIGEWRQRGTRFLSWRIPVRAAGRDDTREILFYDSGEQIAAIDGTGWTARNDNVAVIERPPQGSTASITVRTPIAGKFEAGVPPMPIELRADEMTVMPPSIASQPRREPGSPRQNAITSPKSGGT
jgi:hypothetical protein